jgi:hypothetical protein
MEFVPTHFFIIFDSLSNKHATIILITMEWFNCIFSTFINRLKSLYYSAILFRRLICDWHIVLPMFTDSK